MAKTEKKIKRWLWVFKPKNGVYWTITSNYYTESEAKKCISKSALVEKADWSEKEFKE